MRSMTAQDKIVRQRIHLEVACFVTAVQEIRKFLLIQAIQVNYESKKLRCMREQITPTEVGQTGDDREIKLLCPG